MLLLPRAVRILLAAEPVDLRNSIDGLVALVRSGWKENVFAGHLFVFVSRRRDRVKILTWDSGGFVVFYKRLEQGRFRLPQFHDGALALSSMPHSSPCSWTASTSPTYAVRRSGSPNLSKELDRLPKI